MIEDCFTFAGDLLFFFFWGEPFLGDLPFFFWGEPFVADFVFFLGEPFFTGEVKIVAFGGDIDFAEGMGLSSSESVTNSYSFSVTKKN